MLLGRIETEAVTTPDPRDDSAPARRITPLRFLGGALVLLVLSRIPFLLHTPDFGVFLIEHMWMLEDPAAVRLWERITGLSGTVGQIDPALHAVHYHGGGGAVTSSVLHMSRLTGHDGLVQLELVGLLATALALAAYFSALVQLWPGQRARWGFALFLAFLAPPSLLFWLTLVPMGHFTETWFFHALALPAFVVLCRGRAGPLTVALIGVGAGLATWYVFSNAIFVGLFALSILLWSSGGWVARATRLAVLGGAWATTWLTTAWPRLVEVRNRVVEASRATRDDGTDQEGWGRMFTNIRPNLREVLDMENWIDGGPWCMRGLFAITEPAGSSLGTAAGLFVGALVAVGAIYISAHVLLLLRPKGWREMTLPQRIYAIQGLFLLPLTAAFFIFRDPGNQMALIAYLTPNYAVWLFGLGQTLGDALAASNPWVRRIAGGIALTVSLLLAVGWVDRSAWVSRPLDRPELQATGFRQVTTAAFLDMQREHGDEAARRIRDYCNKAHPGNESFCAEIAWTEAFHPPEPNAQPGDGATSMLASCLGLPEAERRGCATAVGGRMGGSPACQFGAEMAPQGRLCAGFPAELRQECLTGVHRGVLPRHRDHYSCAVNFIMMACGAQTAGTPRDWRFRACLEGFVPMLAGMPAWPVPSSSAATGPCAAWPPDFRGICEDLVVAQQAAPGEPSCEDIYLERFADTLPTKNGLIYEQCMFMGSFPGGWEYYPSCVIGIAKVLDGLECSWSGRELKLL